MQGTGSGSGLGLHISLQQLDRHRLQTEVPPVGSIPVQGGPQWAARSEDQTDADPAEGSAQTLTEIGPGSNSVGPVGCVSKVSRHRPRRDPNRSRSLQVC